MVAIIHFINLKATEKKAHNEGGEGYIPTLVTKEQYQQAKKILNK